jgi:GxxExxY protein
MTQNSLNALQYAILGAAIEVHKELGPGLLESIYEKCLIHELKQRGIGVVSQQKVPLIFKGLHLDCDLRFDLLIEDEIVVEIKSVDAIAPIHQAQLLTYLKLMDKSKGILINFNCTNLYNEGQKVMVTPKFASMPKV